MNVGLQVVDRGGVVTLIKVGFCSFEQDLQVKPCLLVQNFGINQLLDLTKNQVDFSLSKKFHLDNRAKVVLLSNTLVLDRKPEDTIMSSNMLKLLSL